MRSGKLCIGLAAVALASAMGAAHAGAITGLVDTGAGLADGQLDPNYAVVTTPAVDGPSSGAAAVVGGGFPFPSWMTPPAGANWISAYGRNSDLDATANGDYLYQLTFDLPTAAKFITITGEWAADNFGDGILLNGVSTGESTALGASGSSFAALTPFSITGSGNAGLNFLDFEVENYAQSGGNPTGLLVVFESDSYTPAIPEPSTWAMLTLGFAGLALAGFRRTRRQRLATTIS